MVSPFTLPPHPAAQDAASEVINKVHAYMREHPESELHRQGKMFGVLVVEPSVFSHQHSDNYLAAFSAMLDGSYYHEGFVPPVYEIPTPPVGSSKSESQRLQRLLFTNCHLLNGKGESKNLLEIFAHEKPIIPADEWFAKSKKNNNQSPITNQQLPINNSLPPSGAGECCAPKLLQYAFTHGLIPLALAEFWIGAPPKNELRQEGVFYPPCSGKCVPILKHMLQGIEVQQTEDESHAEQLCKQIEVLYEDEYLVVVNKPAGLLSVPGKTSELSVEAFLGYRAVHRLDQDTSGLLVLAKQPEIYTALQAYFQRRDILKRYEAIVKGHCDKVACTKEGMISLPLLPNPYDRPRQMVDQEHGKAAITRYVIREYRADGSCLVDFYPLTGRTHQLRVHAAHPDGLNAPIVGDRLYGQAAERLMLHATEISFVHPVTKEEMHFCIPSRF